MSVKSYANVVLEKAGLRRAIRLADELRAAAYDEDGERIDLLLADPMASILPMDTDDPPTEASILAGEEHAPDMIVPHLLGRQEIVLWVGEPGHGKSTLLRQ